MTLFIGPVGIDGGPAIKNRLLIKYLDKNCSFKVCNTHRRTLKNFIKSIFTLILSRDKQVIVAVSKNGRTLLYPILSIKKKIYPSMHYSTICIGGTIANDVLKYPKGIKKALASADVVSVETKKIKKELEEKCDLINIHYMPNYKEIKKDTKYQVKEFNNDKLKFVFLSSIRNVKGISTMINAFKEVLCEFPNAILDIYGPIRDDFDRRIFENIKNISQINYKGVVSNEEVINILSKYDVFLFPTEYTGEGFPAVLVEAYLAGLVVIASDINFNTEIVKNDINGWIFPTGNEELLKKSILYCFNNTIMLKNISENNRRYAINFDVERVVEEYRNALKMKGWKL